jgi:glycosyltransferase involved in cell wall biosynthesis
MKSILIVAYYFPPVAASGAMRPLGFCRYLEQYGWRPWVLTTTPESVYPAHSVDQQLLARLPSTVKIESVPYTNPLHRMIAIRNRLRHTWRSGIAVKSHNVIADGPISTPAKPQPPKARSSMKDLILDGSFSFPDPQCSWLGPAVRRFSDLKREEFPQLVLATGGPWTSLLVGQMLAKRFGVPFIADYRDPWTSNPYDSYSSPFLTNKAKRLEQSVCLSAARVIANTEELRLKFCENYPQLRNTCITIPNGFDPESFIEEDGVNALMDRSTTPGVEAEGVELCHFGTVYGKRSPLQLFQAVWELYAERLVTADQIRMRFVGAWDVDDSRCEKLAQDLETHGFLRRETPVSHQICLQQMAHAKALLIIQPDSPLQIPGKIYEYIAVGRPLLLIGGEGATANLVERHQLGVSCPNDVSRIKPLLRQVAGGGLALNPPAKGCTDRFDYRTLAGELAQLLDTVSAEQEEARS